MIPYGRQHITDEDIEAVVSVLRSPMVTQGPAVEDFEQCVASFCGAAGSVAMNSATSALQAAYCALGLGEGDILWTSPITFVATANAALHCGATVDFVDIDPLTANMSVDSLQLKLRDAKARGRLPKVVVPVHMAGQSCDMRGIGRLADKYGFKVVEDASHAIGGEYLNQKIGGCAYSDITVFSFHPVKIITTGEGGAATSNDAELLEKMRLVRSHGVTRDERMMTSKSEGGWYYQQVDLGHNFRMTDIQAALGTSQAMRINDYVEARNVLAGQYAEQLAHLPLKLPTVNADTYSAFHLYLVQLTEECAIDRATVFGRLRTSGIGVNVHYIPVHLQPYYTSLGFRRGDFPAAEAYYETVLSLPLFPTMTGDELTEVVCAITQAVQ